MSWSVSHHGPASYPARKLGWKSKPCSDSGHSGVIAGRCADCGKRAEKKEHVA